MTWQIRIASTHHSKGTVERGRARAADRELDVALLAQQRAPPPSVARGVARCRGGGRARGGDLALVPLGLVAPVGPRARALLLEVGDLRRVARLSKTRDRSRRAGGVCAIDVARRRDSGRAGVRRAFDTVVTSRSSFSRRKGGRPVVV